MVHEGARCCHHADPTQPSRPAAPLWQAHLLAWFRDTTGPPKKGVAQGGHNTIPPPAASAGCDSVAHLEQRGLFAVLGQFVQAVGFRKVVARTRVPRSRVSVDTWYSCRNCRRDSRNPCSTSA